MRSSSLERIRGTWSARLAGLVLAAVTALAIGSCGEDTVTSPGPYLPPAGTTEDLLALTRRALPANFIYPIQITTLAEVQPSIVVSADVQLEDAASAAFRGTLGLIEAGHVSVSATGTGWYELFQVGLTVSGIPQWLYSNRLPSPEPIALVFDGNARHHFRATGSSVFPAFEDSIVSVKEIGLTWPPNNVLLDRDEDALVSWNISPDPTSVFVMAAVYAPTDTNFHFGQVIALDSDGSLMIPAVALQAVPHTHEAAQAIISVARYRQEDRTVAGRALRLLCESVKIRTVTLLDSIPGGGANRPPQLARSGRR